MDYPKYVHAVGTLAYLIRGSNGLHVIEEESDLRLLASNPYFIPGTPVLLHTDHVRFLITNEVHFIFFLIFSKQKH